MNRFLTLWPQRFPYFGCIDLWGGGVGGALILDRCRAFDLFASVDAHLCSIVMKPGLAGWLLTAQPWELQTNAASGGGIFINQCQHSNQGRCSIKSPYICGILFIYFHVHNSDLVSKCSVERHKIIGWSMKKRATSMVVNVITIPSNYA
jgi:hypothetical protein